MQSRATSQIVIVGTALGLVPLLAGLVLIVVPTLLPLTPMLVERAVIGYAALFLAFLGGVRWGIRIDGKNGTDMTYLLGALGPALGLVTLVLPFAPALAMLTVGFAAQGAWDAWSGQRKTVPEPYARQRIVATMMICLTLIVILFARAALVPAT